MSIKEKIDRDMKMAQKSGDKTRLNITRLLKSEIKYKEIDKKDNLSDEETLEVLQTSVKRHRDSIEQFQKGGRNDLVEKEEAELKIILEYLPQQLTEEELTSMIDETIKEVEASGPKDLGKVMKVLIPKVKGRADGKKVNVLVSQRLEPECEVS
jgi:uncharacterized protein YqeY